MNREACVLIYSQYSQASGKLMEYISSLSYDLVALTGMVLLQADSQMVRDRLSDMTIDVVPSIFVKYFDGTTQLHAGDEVYDFIAAVSRAVNIRAETATSAKIDNDDNDDDDDRVVKEKPIEISKKDVMNAAAEMLKMREMDEKRKSDAARNQLLIAEKKKRTKLT